MGAEGGGSCAGCRGFRGATAEPAMCVFLNLLTYLGAIILYSLRKGAKNTKMLPRIPNYFTSEDAQAFINAMATNVYRIKRLRRPYRFHVICADRIIRIFEPRDLGTTIEDYTQGFVVIDNNRRCRGSIFMHGQYPFFRRDADWNNPYIEQDEKLSELIGWCKLTESEATYKRDRAVIFLPKYEL